MDKETKIILLLRILILVLLIYFFFVFNGTSKTDCEDCSFEIEGKEYSSEEFFNMYADRCLVKQKILALPNSYKK